MAPLPKLMRQITDVDATVLKRLLCVFVRMRPTCLDAVMLKIKSDLMDGEVPVEKQRSRLLCVLSGAVRYAGSSLLPHLPFVLPLAKAFLRDDDKPLVRGSHKLLKNIIRSLSGFFIRDFSAIPPSLRSSPAMELWGLYYHPLICDISFERPSPQCMAAAKSIVCEAISELEASLATSSAEMRRGDARRKDVRVLRTVIRSGAYLFPSLLRHNIPHDVVSSSGDVRGTFSPMAFLNLEDEEFRNSTRNRLSNLILKMGNCIVSDDVESLVDFCKVVTSFIVLRCRSRGGGVF
jgi:hypothetical protein